MLCLTRTHNQSIIINGNIIVKIKTNRGNKQVTVCIDAPKDISVHREEVQKKIDLANATN